jgi:MtN3 and saliva related transmembrane protein
MSSLFINLIGYTATVVGMCLMLPQIIKSWRTRSMGDVSMGMVVLFFFNCSLWLVYGFLINAMPMVISSLICVIESIVQVILKLKYR